MKLKNDIDIIQFLKTVQNCQRDVFLKTAEGDLLNLNSVISQYAFIDAMHHKKNLANGIIECKNPDDAFCLSAYLCED